MMFRAVSFDALSAYHASSELYEAKSGVSA
jgi:hypothetical protein